jgi:hypothetical protein
MNSLTQYTFFSEILAFASLFFCLVALVAVLNSLWRAHKMLATFIKLCIVSVAVFALRKVLGVLGYNQAVWWTAVAQYFDITQSFFFMLAALEFYKIMRVMDGETFGISGLKPSEAAKKNQTLPAKK